MSDWKLPWSGSCLCGQVKIQVTHAPVFSAACHCRACQKLSGGAFSQTLMLPADGLIVEGQTEIGGLHSPVPQHHFCPSCKTWLFSKGIAGGQFVNLRPSLLDDYKWFVPYADTCVDEALPQSRSGASVRYPSFPPPEDYGKLFQGFDADSPRPSN